MKVVLRDPPFPLLMTAILLNLQLTRVRRPSEDGPKPGRWASRTLDRFLEWRNALTQRSVRN